MKKFTGFYFNVLLLTALVLFGSINLPAQRSDFGASKDSSGLAGDELRPFDFSDKYYETHGVIAGMLAKRHNGKNGLSVFDVTSDQDHNGVRILATRPAYGHAGETLYWNFYGEISNDGFADSTEGKAAVELALNFPIYVFPGGSRSGGAERQAPIIDLTDGYYEKNALGLGVVMTVRYNFAAVQTKMDAAYLQELANTNGLAADGTPVIRTVRQLDQLSRRNLISITQAGAGMEAPFIVGKVLRYPGYGALAPDAFLLYTTDPKGEALTSELFFLKTFTCLKDFGGTCN
jgi:hypothetical protein